MDAPKYAVLIVDFDAPALVAALQGAAGQSTTQYLMTDSALTPTLWGAGPFDFTFLTRIRGTAPALPAFTDPSGPVYAAFDVSYRAAVSISESPADTAFVANAYDAAYAIAIGAAAVGGVADGARHRGEPCAHVGRERHAVRDRAGAVSGGRQRARTPGGNIDLVGHVGPDRLGRRRATCVTAPTEVWQVRRRPAGCRRSRSSTPSTRSGHSPCALRSSSAGSWGATNIDIARS